MPTIRTERPTDIAAIHDVTREAFLTAKHASGTEPFIVDALRDAGALTISLVAEDEGRIIGHVAASPVEIDGGPSGWFGIGPLSVAPDRRRRGIGAALMRAVLEQLRNAGVAGCVLLGDPDYYGRFGFGPASPLVLPDVPAEYFQALTFRGSKPEGIVRYHPAFEVTGESTTG